MKKKIDYEFHLPVLEQLNQVSHFSWKLLINYRMKRITELATSNYWPVVTVRQLLKLFVFTMSHKWKLQVSSITLFVALSRWIYALDQDGSTASRTTYGVRIISVNRQTEPKGAEKQCETYSHNFNERSLNKNTNSWVPLKMNRRLWKGRIERQMTLNNFLNWNEVATALNISLLKCCAT